MTAQPAAATDHRRANLIPEPYRELSAIILRHVDPASPELWSCAELGLSCATVRQHVAPSGHVYEPSFALIVQGEKELVLGDEVFACTRGSFVVVSVDLPMTFRIVATPERPYVALSMRIRPTQVASLLLESAARAVVTEPRSPSDGDALGIGKSEVDDALLDAVVRLVRLLDCPRDRAVIGPLVERELLWRLLCSSQGARLREVGLADGRLAQIARATRSLRDNYAATLRIEELARVAAMSVTSFHRHFRAVTRMSPLQYQKRIRLQEARAKLLHDGADVAAIGHAVGYESPSQFSREYKRAFGVPPGEDGRLLRARR